MSTNIFVGPQGNPYAGPQGQFIGGPLATFDEEVEATSPVDQLDLIRRRNVGDVALVFDPVSGSFDMEILGDDLARDPGVSTSTIISLLTDSRASDDDLTDDEDPRGWWGEQATQFGSLVWLLHRAKRVERSLEIARESVTRSLSWMISVGVAKTVTVRPRYEGAVLVVSINIERGLTPRWASVWDEMEPGLYRDQGVQLELAWS